MLASLDNSTAQQTGKASSDLSGSLFPLELTPSGPVTLARLRELFPSVPPRVLLVLLVVALADDSVSPFRVCECGCGEPVTGKERMASPACRKRLQRERDAAREASGDRQYQIPLQAELGSPLPPPPPNCDRT